MSITMMEEKLKEAIQKKQLDVNSFVWKGSKQLDATGKFKQSEIKLMAMSQQELRDCYDHCKTMLFVHQILNLPHCVHVLSSHYAHVLIEN